MDRVTNARRFSDFVTSLYLTSSREKVKKQYLRLVEDNGNYCIFDIEDVIQVVISGEKASVTLNDAIDESDIYLGTILNPEIVTSTVKPDDKGVYRCEGVWPRNPIGSREIAAVRVRPLGQGQEFADSRFVELQFKGGGFLRAIASAFEVQDLEYLILNGDQNVISWRAGTHEILLRRDHLSGCEIDRHKRGDGHRTGASHDDRLNVRLVTSDGFATDVQISNPPTPVFKREYAFTN